VFHKIPNSFGEVVRKPGLGGKLPPYLQHEG